MIIDTSIFVEDRNLFFEELATLTISLSNTNYSVFQNPTEDTINFIKLSSLYIVPSDDLHRLILSKYNINKLDNEKYRDICESIIKNDAYGSFLYASVYLKDRFIEGETAMAENDEIWIAYKHMLNNNYNISRYNGRYTY